MISGGKKVDFEWTEWGPVQDSHGEVIGGPEWEHCDTYCNDEKCRCGEIVVVSGSSGTL